MDGFINLLNEVRSGSEITESSVLYKEFDSLDIIAALTMIYEVYGSKIPPAEIIPENFASPGALYKVVLNGMPENR